MDVAVKDKDFVRKNASLHPRGARIFVGQVPKIMTKQELLQLFRQFGTVQDLRIIKDKATGVHKGCLFVTYSLKEEAETAIRELHEKVTLPPVKNPLQVKFAPGEEERLASEGKLFVGMVPKDCTEDDLLELFSQIGEVEEVAILRGPQHASRGCGFVKFKNREDAQTAIKTHHGTMPFKEAAGPLVVKFADTERQRKHKKLLQNQQLQQQEILQEPAEMDPSVGPFLQPFNFPPFWNPYQLGLQFNSVGGLFIPPNPMMPTLSPSVLAALQSQIPSPDFSFSIAEQGTSYMAGPPNSNLFIYHLPQEFGDADLVNTFSSFGTILSAKVFIDKNTGQSKCFGFVSFDNPESAAASIRHMNGYQIGNKRLRVQLKRNGKAN